MKIQDIPSNTFLSDAPDLESRLPQDDQSALRLWLRLLSCSTLIENELRSCLRRKFNTTLPRFELMAQLASRPEGMKMTALSRHMLVTNEIGRASCRERVDSIAADRQVSYEG